MDKENNFSRKLGHFVADAFVTCLAACVVALAVALTMRFIMWLF